MARKKLGEMLVEAGALTESGLRMALVEQRRWGGTLGRILIDMKLLSEGELVSTLGQQLHLPTIDLDTIEIHPTVLDLIPGEVAEQHSIMPFAQPMKFLDVAMAEPTNLGVIDELRIRTQLNIRPYLAGPKMLERALAKHYRRGFGRMLNRRDADISLESHGDTVSPGLAEGVRARPDSAEIDAARRREGLRPSPRPTRPPGLDVHTPATGTPVTTPSLPPSISARPSRDAEIDALQDRISTLEALVERDEEVLRKLLALLVEKGVATREEILERIHG
jgi:type IV pilus assembly protein PilB